MNFKKLICSVFMLAALCATPLAASAAPVTAVRSSVSPARVRLVFDSREPVKYTAEKNGLQLVVTLPEGTALTQKPVFKQDAVIKSITVPAKKKKKAQVVIDLTKDCQYKLYPLKNPDRLVLDIYRIPISKTTMQLSGGVTYTYAQEELNGRPLVSYLVSVAPSARLELRPFSAAGMYNGRGSLARPQSAEQNTRTNTDGIDIMLALDVSGSMLARDFRPDRLEAAKEVAGSFIADRYGDRIGLVVFAGEAFTQSPLTADQSTLLTLLGRVRSGLIEDGTAIGNGLATAINRLRESDAKSKVIILLTDGVNNRGEIAPVMAAEIAKEQGIRVYTIGVGSRGTAPTPAIDMFGNMTFVQAKVEIDEKTLQEIADATGGRYFRATDNEKLRAIYDEINRLEKSKVEVADFTTYTEEYLRWVLAALALLAAEFLIRTLILKRIP